VSRLLDDLECVVRSGVVVVDSEWEIFVRESQNGKFVDLNLACEALARIRSR
jgi:hypothetical protein